jgi:hypothetical protein
MHGMNISQGQNPAPRISLSKAFDDEIDRMEQDFFRVYRFIAPLFCGIIIGICSVLYFLTGRMPLPHYLLYVTTFLSLAAYSHVVPLLIMEHGRQCRERELATSEVNP